MTSHCSLSKQVISFQLLQFMLTIYSSKETLFKRSRTLKFFLHTEFKIKDLGLLHYFLGMEILREEQGMIISQRKYTLDVLEEFDVSHLSTVSSPLDPSVKLTAELGTPLLDPTVYRHFIGKINYLTHTRPDLSFAILTLSQFMQTPTTDHFNAGLRVIRYLKDFPSHSFFFTVSPSFSLNTFCDADWHLAGTLANL